jgi:hypothetical protein
VHAVCDQCAREWSNPHWDLIKDSAKAYRPITVSEVRKP